MNVPDIVFTEWAPWADRNQIKGASHPGVYILARFESRPLGIASPLTEEIIYFGETCSQTLAKRWNQFNRSAFFGKFGHSGGLTYRGKFGDEEPALYVAAFPVYELPSDIQPHFIRFVERRVIWQFILKWNHVPVCNRK